MINQAISEFGHIDILVNNAGTTLNHTAINVTEEEWDKVFDLNLKSVFFVAQAVGKHMIERGYGRIVKYGISSIGTYNYEYDSIRSK